MHVVATAGHVDHGKSSLVRALTGADPDRWDEEKRRGLTIDLGFGFLTLADGTPMAFVDVPGHVRFLPNMLAGVGGVPAAVLVVAATEGWMPQTEEHLRILEVLGVAHGLTVVTMADAVDDDTLELAQLEASERVAGTFLDGAPIVACDSVSGRGLDGVGRALEALAAGLPPPLDAGRPRLWVDRAFTIRGAGTVVTGTLAGGALDVGTEVVVEPGGRVARIRGVESGHTRADRAAPGARVALNLADVGVEEVGRGHAVVLAGQWEMTDTVDGRLTLLPGAAPPGRGALKAYVGSGEHGATARELGGGFVRVRFDTPLPLAPGDRLVLRDPGPDVTVGGVEILDVAPARRLRDAPARLRLPLPERVLAGEPVMTVADFARQSGLSAAGAEESIERLVATGAGRRVGPRVLATDEAGRVLEAVAEAVDRWHVEHPHDPGVEVGVVAGRLGRDAGLVAELAGEHGFRVEAGRIGRPDHTPSVEDDPGARRLLGALEAAPFSPPAPADVGVSNDVVRALGRAGLLVEAGGVYFAASAYESAVGIVSEALAERGELTVGELRDLLGSSRKHVIPLLDRLDRDGVTRRKGNVRVAGPKAAGRAGLA